MHRTIETEVLAGWDASAFLFAAFMFWSLIVFYLSQEEITDFTTLFFGNRPSRETMVYVIIGLLLLMAAESYIEYVIWRIKNLFRLQNNAAGSP